jgi:hypothetical protein
VGVLIVVLVFNIFPSGLMCPEQVVLKVTNGMLRLYNSHVVFIKGFVKASATNLPGGKLLYSR